MRICQIFHHVKSGMQIAHLMYLRLCLLNCTASTVLTLVAWCHLYIVFCSKIKTRVYIEAFTALQSKMLELGLTVDLEVFRVDFETASHKATKEVFPGIEIACCFFLFWLSEFAQRCQFRFQAKVYRRH